MVALAAATQACSLGDSGGPDADIGELSQASTVNDYLGSSCSTSVVLGLSRQIADEVVCLAPDKLTSFAEGDGVAFSGSAVLPYLDPSAKADLLDAVGAQGGTIQINSGFRTVVQQYLLYQWYRRGRCGITAAATPGSSNHESGRALDVGNYGDWVGTLGGHGWAHDVAGDPVHFDHLSSPDLRGYDILAFQRLWNRNNPGDQIDEDGVYGPQTEGRLAAAPAEGFATGACNAPSDWNADLVLVDAPDQLAPDAVADVVVKVKNTGLETWKPGETFLGTTGPRDRDSSLYDPDTWVSPSRAATVDTAVAPGEVASFHFQIEAPELAQDTTVKESFGLVEEGVSWFGPETIDVELLVGSGGPGLAGGCRAAPDAPGHGGAVGGGGLALLALGPLALVVLRRRTGGPRARRSDQPRG